MDERANSSSRIGGVRYHFWLSAFKIRLLSVERFHTSGNIGYRADAQQYNIALQAYLNRVGGCEGNTFF